MTSARMTLADGHNVLVDVCDEGIFRVRISPRKEFEESLMERYGCLKTDWTPVKTTETKKGSEWTVSTGKYSLSINKKTGAICLKDAKGGAVIREIRLLDNGDKLCGNLRETINKKWQPPRDHQQEMGSPQRREQRRRHHRRRQGIRQDGQKGDPRSDEDLHYLDPNGGWREVLRRRQHQP